MLQVHPGNSSQAHGNIDSHCTALRTASCTTCPVLLSIGTPSSLLSNTGIPWRKPPSTFTRNRCLKEANTAPQSDAPFDFCEYSITYNPQLLNVSHVTVSRTPGRGIMARSDRRPELYAAALIPYTAAAAALICRNVARRKTRVTMTWEDYLSIVAFVNSLILLRNQVLTLV